MAAVCDDLLLIETMVCDSRDAVLRLEDETKSFNQALRGLAHRASPSYLAIALNRVGFEYVYAATDPPDHRDYRFSWLDNLDTARDGRCCEASSSRVEAHCITAGWRRFSVDLLGQADASGGRDYPVRSSTW
jgi:hypothetical protein